MQKTNVVLFIILLNGLTVSGSYGQSSSIPQWVIDDWEFRTKGVGVWVASNSKYQSDDEPFDSYGIEWEWGIGKKSLKGRLYCIQNRKDVRTAWEFLEYWNPQSGELSIIQVGSNGTVGQGTAWIEEDGSTKSRQTFTNPDGTSSLSGHHTKNVDGDSHSSSYDIDGEKWLPRRSYVWKNSLSSTKEVATPEEYRKFEFLIGSWQIDFGDRFVIMTFEWAQNNMMIRYKSTNPTKPGEPINYEVEGMIAYHGVKEEMVFMSAYLDFPPTLMNEGHFEFPKEGVIERIFTVFYQEGAGIPWSNGEKAPKGGKPVDFKQVWTKLDDNSFNGEFFWNKNGKWESPYQAAKKELWRRVK